MSYDIIKSEMLIGMDKNKVIETLGDDYIKGLDNKIIYEAAFPVGIFLPMKLTEGTVFGFNFIHNDNDGSGREGWLELTPGIGWGKNPYHYYGAILLKK